MLWYSRFNTEVSEVPAAAKVKGPEAANFDNKVCSCTEAFQQLLSNSPLTCLICLSRSVRNLGLIFDDKLSMKQQVSKICQSAYLELHRISSIRHVLTVDATKILVTSLVLSRLDYCNFLLSGVPQQLIDKLQKVQKLFCSTHFQNV